MRIGAARQDTQLIENMVPDSEVGPANKNTEDEAHFGSMAPSGEAIAPMSQPEAESQRDSGTLKRSESDPLIRPLLIGVRNKIPAAHSDHNAHPAAPPNPRSSQVATWPPPYLSHAKLSETKGWHLLNEVTYGLWSAATVSREAMHIAAASKEEWKTFSISSHLPVANEGALVGGAFSLIEAIGTAHLVCKAGRKKSELDQALSKHAAGRRRFVDGAPEIANLLGERHALSTLLQTWPRDEETKLLPEWQRDAAEPPLNLQRTQEDQKGVEEKLVRLALDLAADFEHYVRYEQAANQLAEATDNLHAMGVAAARDSVVQLGGAACNATEAAVKLGAQGVDVAATGVASGAFGMAMGALHMGAAAVGWYQSERTLADLAAVRSRRADLRTVDGREQQVLGAAERHRQWLKNQAARTESAAVRQSHAASAAAPVTESVDDVASANRLIEIVLHHQDKSFEAIEATELKKKSRAKFRMGYGAASMAVGAGFVALATIGTGGLFVTVLAAAALALGTFWLVSGVARFVRDRIEAYREAKRDQQLKDAAQRILQEQREPTLEEMRSNRFVAIDAMLRSLLNGDRPITRCALTEVLVSLGMDANLLEAIRLRSTVRLDPTYAKDKEDIAQKLRCFASEAKTEALKTAMEGMALRSDEAMLKPLRQLFQEFIEGKTAMRQQYERRTGVLTFLREKLRDVLGKIGFGPGAEPKAAESAAESVFADVSADVNAPMLDGPDVAAIPIRGLAP
ncbi:hypothetical protein J5T34_16330 [Cupriavidus gilardii]|uniref:hypothetical protein n=1 Tax=Cupriavidus gilardii TaxID=82541 RepID=UPI001ABDD363|nr:hypothetical protein [Cupriavidus gilardii]MBO4122292.1 hypothetical protein [Cupriavidus gilardii]